MHTSVLVLLFVLAKRLHIFGEESNPVTFCVSCTTWDRAEGAPARQAHDTHTTGPAHAG